MGALLGTGRIARVYAASTPTGAPVAVKCVPPEHIDVLRRSWEVLRDLRHPNLLTAYALHLDEEGAALVVQRASTSLCTVVLDTRTLWRMLEEVTSGLVALHRAGWVHRDIKPGNLLLTRDGCIVIADFGLATRIGTELEAPVGTPAYMAPEAFLWQCGPPLDWYGLGVTLYELLTGSLPFESASLQGDLLAKQRGRWPRLDGPGMARFAPLVAGLLEPEPEARWTGEDIQTYLAEAPVTSLVSA